MSAHRNFVLAALLATGAVLTPPAFAKEKEAKPAKVSYSPAFVKVAQPAQEALKGDALQAEPLVVKAEAAATSVDDKYAAGLMRLQVEQARIKAAGAGADQQRIRPPLEALLASPRITQEQRGQFAFVLAQLASQRKDKAATLTYLTQAQQAGYSDPNMTVMLAQAKLAAGDLAGGSADLEASIKAAEANGGKAPEVNYRYAIDQLQKQNAKPQAIAMMRRWVAAYPTATNWHDALYIFGLQRGSLIVPDKNQTVDIFRLMRQTNALDRPAFEEYAQKVIDGGFPDEGKAVLNEGIASGKVPRGPNVTALLAQTDRQIGLQGSLAPLEAKAQSAGNGSLAYQTGDAYLGQKNFAKAIALYRVALTKGGVDAGAVNTHLGIALAMSGDKEGARAAFTAVTGSPRADIAQFWIVMLDHPATA